jgi:two-component system invasion response regulator UvrY
MNPIRIIIIDDHALLRETWSFILNADTRFTIIATSGNGEEGIELCKQHRPDIVMLDINLPGINGIEVVPLIKKFAPVTKIVGVSLHTQPSYVKIMMRRGACGYITKNSSRQEMIYALTQIADGKKYICNEMKNIFAQNMLYGDNEQANLNALSGREIEIIKLIKQGSSSKEIASQLSISTKTVEVHRYNILKKLNLKNAAALVNFTNQFDFAC